MPGRDEHASGRWGNGPRGRISGAVLLIAALTCTLEAESPATKANYSVDNWLLADGEDRDAEEVAANSPFRCDLIGCIGKVKSKTNALIRHPAALEEDCRLADIVIAPFSVGKGCSTARVMVDRRALQAEGAHAIHIEGLSIRSESVAEMRGRRPRVPERAVPKPSLPAGHTRDPGAADDGRW